VSDLYALLGIERTATADEVKAAYRRAAMEHHPDRNPGDDEAIKRFQQVKLAYEILSDDEKRATYDATGRIPEAGKDPEAAMREDAIAIFMEAMNQAGPVPSQRDMISIMEIIIAGKQNTLRHSLQQTRSQIAGMEKVKGRFKRRPDASGPNVISGFIEGNIASMNAQCARFEEMIEHGNKLLEYIETYTFDVEPPPSQPVWTTVTSNMSGTTSTSTFG
jgi:curved DNA-binding protein CbpA